MNRENEKAMFYFKSAKFPQTVRPISTDEMLELQNRYAYAHEYNNYNELSYKNYKDWYDKVSQYWQKDNPPLPKKPRGLRI
jgi:hypothetical protein